MLGEMIHNLLLGFALFVVGYVAIKVITHAIQWLAGDADEPNR